MKILIKNLFLFSITLSANCYAISYIVDDPIEDNPVDIDGSLFMSTNLTTDPDTTVVTLTQTIIEDADTTFIFNASQLGYTTFGGETYFTIGISVNEPGNSKDFITLNTLSISVAGIGSPIYDLDSITDNDVQFNPVADDPFTTTVTDAVSFNSGGGLLNIGIFIPTSVLTDNDIQGSDIISLTYNISDLEAASDSIMLASDGTTFTLVPEPSTSLFALIGSAFFLARRRRN